MKWPYVVKGCVQRQVPIRFTQGSSLRRMPPHTSKSNWAISRPSPPAILRQPAPGGDFQLMDKTLRKSVCVLKKCFVTRIRSFSLTNDSGARPPLEKKKYRDTRRLDITKRKCRRLQRVTLPPPVVIVHRGCHFRASPFGTMHFGRHDGLEEPPFDQSV